MRIFKFILLLLLVLIVACSSKGTPVPQLLINISTDPTNYPAGVNSIPTSSPKDGFLGLTKIIVQHGLQDKNGVTGVYIAQGTGNVVVRNSHWYVITARHVVFPNPNLKELLLDPNDPKKKLEFGQIVKTGVKISVGYTGIEPSTIWLPTDQDTDIAILEISPDFAQSVMYQPFDASYDLTKIGMVSPGVDVECWGFPAKQYPQTEKLSISTITNDIFVLNQALEQGYSGGLVAATSGEGSKNILGMILSSDSQSNQSIAISWSIVEEMLQSVVNNSPTTLAVVQNMPINYANVNFTYYDYYNFPFISSSPKQWWEFWKK